MKQKIKQIKAHMSEYDVKKQLAHIVHASERVRLQTILMLTGIMFIMTTNLWLSIYVGVACILAHEIPIAYMGMSIRNMDIEMEEFDDDQ